MKLLLTSLALFSFAAVGYSQYAWYPCQQHDYPHWLMLHNGDQLVGGYNRKTKEYKNVSDKGEWSQPTTAPYPVPGPLKDWGDPVRNEGVDFEKVGTGYRLSGQPISKEKAYELVGDPTLVDDSKKKWLVAVGSKEEQEKARQAYESVKQFFKDEIIFSQYEPDHWHVDGLFDKGLSYQKANGGMMAFGQTIPDTKLFAKILREADPAYDKGKVRQFSDFDSWWRNLNFDFGRVHPGVWVAAGVLVVMIFMSKKGK